MDLSLIAIDLQSFCGDDKPTKIKAKEAKTKFDRQGKSLEIAFLARHHHRARSGAEREHGGQSDKVTSCLWLRQAESGEGLRHLLPCASEREDVTRLAAARMLAWGNNHTPMGRQAAHTLTHACTHTFK